MSQIVITAKLTLKPEYKEEGLEKFKVLHKMTNENDEGCIQYDLHISAEEENTYMFIETWESQEALIKHTQAKHFKDFEAFAEDAISLFKVEKLKKIA